MLQCISIQFYWSCSGSILGSCASLVLQNECYPEKNQFANSYILDFIIPGNSRGLVTPPCPFEPSRTVCPNWPLFGLHQPSTTVVGIYYFEHSCIHFRADSRKKDFPARIPSRHSDSADYTSLSRIHAPYPCY